MRDPDTVTEPTLVCSSGLEVCVLTGGGLSATLSLAVGAVSSANAQPTANIAPSAKMQAFLITRSADLQPTALDGRSTIATQCAVAGSSATPASPRPSGSDRAGLTGDHGSQPRKQRWRANRADPDRPCERQLRGNFSRSSIAELSAGKPRK